MGPIEHVNDDRINLAALLEAVENENDRDAMILLAEIEVDLTISSL
ncbi:hypothetical protein ACERII_00065 [Evansella sp. AB-rgal1]